MRNILHGAQTQYTRGQQSPFFTLTTLLYMVHHAGVDIDRVSRVDKLLSTAVII